MKRFGRTGALAATVAVAAIAIGAAGCGEEHHSEVVEGEPIELGDLRFNVQLTRFLNPNDREDSEYLEDLPPADPNTSYLGVFIEVENEGDETVRLPTEEQMEIRDTTDAIYHPIETETVFGFDFGEEIEPDQRIPLEDTAAASGGIQGQVIVFLVSDDVSENRPLELEIVTSSGDEGIIELDI